MNQQTIPQQSKQIVTEPPKTVVSQSTQVAASQQQSQPTQVNSLDPAQALKKLPELNPAQARVLLKNTVQQLSSSGLDIVQATKVMQNLKSVFPSEHTQLNLQIQQENRQIKAEASQLPPLSNQSVSKWFNGEVVKATVAEASQSVTKDGQTNQAMRSVVVAINKEQVTLTYPASSGIEFSKGQQLALVVDKVANSSAESGKTGEANKAVEAQKAVQLILKTSTEQSKVLIQAENKLSNPKQSVAPLLASVDSVHKQIDKPQADKIYPKEFIQAVKKLVADFATEKQLTTKEGVQQAVKNSGLFLEKNIQFETKAETVTQVSRHLEKVVKDISTLDKQAKSLNSATNNKLELPPKIVQQFNLVATQIVAQSKIPDSNVLSLDTVKNNMFDAKMSNTNNSNSILSSLIRILQSTQSAPQPSAVIIDKSVNVSQSTGNNSEKIVNTPAVTAKTTETAITKEAIELLKQVKVDAKTIELVEKLDKPKLTTTEQKSVTQLQNSASKLFESLSQNPATSELKLSTKEINQILSALSRLIIDKNSSIIQNISSSTSNVTMSSKNIELAAKVVEKSLLSTLPKSVVDEVKKAVSTLSNPGEAANVKHSDKSERIFNSINKVVFDSKQQFTKPEVQQILNLLGRTLEIKAASNSSSLNISSPSGEKQVNSQLPQQVVKEILRHQPLNSEQKVVVDAQKKEINQAVLNAAKAFESSKASALIQQLVQGKTNAEVVSVINKLSQSIDVKQGLSAPDNLLRQQMAKLLIDSLTKSMGDPQSKSPISQQVVAHVTTQATSNSSVSTIQQNEMTKTVPQSTVKSMPQSSSQLTGQSTGQSNIQTNNSLVEREILKSLNQEVKSPQDLKKQLEKIEVLLKQLDIKQLNAAQTGTKSIEAPALDIKNTSNAVNDNKTAQNAPRINSLTIDSAGGRVLPEIKQIQQLFSQMEKEQASGKAESINLPKDENKLTQKQVSDLLQKIQARENVSNELLKSLIRLAVKNEAGQFQATQQLLAQTQLASSGKVTGNELLNSIQQLLSVKTGKMPSTAMSELSPKVFDSLQNLLSSYQTQFKQNNSSSFSPNANSGVAQTAQTAQTIQHQQFVQQMAQIQDNLSQIKAQQAQASPEVNKQSLSDLRVNIQRLLTVLKEMPAIVNPSNLSESLSKMPKNINKKANDTVLPTKHKHAQVVRSVEQAMPPLSQFVLFQQQLTEQLESSLSRIVATQISSREQGEQQNSLSLEIPFRFLDKTQILQMKMTAQEKNDLSESKIWTANLAFELESLGPIRVYITLDTNDVAMQFWAEEKPTQTIFHQNFNVLSERLLEAGYSISQLTAYHGVPGDAQEEQIQQVSKSIDSLVDERV